MQFSEPLLSGHLIRRYKRFLADCVLADGAVVTAHCPNTGAMSGCMAPGSQVWLSRSDNPKRKYPLTWEIARVGANTLVGINTARANPLVVEAIESGRIPALRGYERIRREVRFGREGSRVDILLERDGSRPCYVEVKNVTAALPEGIALFPDAVTARGTRHLRELAYMVEKGARCVVFFCVQRSDVQEVRPADDIDPAYGQALRAALAQGVESMAWRARVSDKGIRLHDMLPVVCP
uniref:Sugar fermentation stimulation protein homolog n=1 Tax=Candidatus Kentrum sp. LPFa TaxID=2126335 RepID=A0A450WMV6_9GAMM|nr:MAG: sugar fermentation stimulation protein A [Candidatus Kentron sp. LPFa]